MSAMNSIIKISKLTRNFIKLHKSTICVCGGIVVGGVAIVECGKATVKAVRKVDELNTERMANGEEKMTKKEVVKECAKTYVPTVALATTSTVLILYGHKCTLKQLSLATAGAKLIETEYCQLKESIEDVLGDSEHDELKGKVLDRYSQRKKEVLYGDSNNPIDNYYSDTYVDNVLHGTSITKDKILSNTGEWRFKDEYGGEFRATRADVRYGVSEIRNMILSGMDASMVDFYNAVVDDSSKVRYPEKANFFVFEADNLQKLQHVDARVQVSEDADGPFYMIHWSEEPTYMD